MPPRRSARVADASARAADPRSARILAAAQRAAPALAPLPYALVLHILSLLPVDCRLRCAEVCRSWRAALEDTSLWIRLDLSASGVSPKRAVTDALLHAAVARARGELVALDLRLRDNESVTINALLAVLTANSALRELRTLSFWDDEESRSIALGAHALEALLLAAPRLEVFEADVDCHDLALAHRLLRNEPPFAPLRVRSFVSQHTEGELDEAAVLALAADFAFHAHLRRLELVRAPLNTAAALDAVMNPALTRRLTSVTLDSCLLSPESAPALVRLIGGGALTKLDLFGDDAEPLLDGPAALALGNALRASSTLTAVSLGWLNLWREPTAATALLGALTQHPSLRSLNISSNRADPAGLEEAGAALGALVAANAPALTAMDVSACELGDAGLGPLFDALPANTHLRTLDCSFNNLTDAFVRDTLLPAVRANASLRELKLPLQSDDAREAEALVQRRANAE